VANIDDVIAALSERLSVEDMTALTTKLDTLRGIKTQEQFDEGARLHAAKNAPWVSGPYSHLPPEVLNPKWVYKEFPRMVYDAHYEQACRDYDAAWMIPARGTEDHERATALMLAQRAKDTHSKIVRSQAELDALAGVFYTSPAEAVKAAQAREAEIATIAAHRAYEDRLMGERAKAEIDAFDERAEAHVPVIPETPRKKVGRPKKAADAVEA
jgi:hypothetical protein